MCACFGGIALYRYKDANKNFSIGTELLREVRRVNAHIVCVRLRHLHLMKQKDRYSWSPHLPTNLVRRISQRFFILLTIKREFGHPEGELAP